MKCRLCNNTNMAFVEETKRRKSPILYIINKLIVLIDVIVLLNTLTDIIRFAGRNEAINTSGITTISIITAILILINAIYSYFYNKTSRTKCICKNCGAWWYISQESLDDMYGNPVKDFHKFPEDGLTK